MAKIIVKNQTIKTLSKNGVDYICITDIARQKNTTEPKDVVKNWLRSKNTLEYLGLWEQLNNPNFLFLPKNTCLCCIEIQAKRFTCPQTPLVPP